MRSRPLERFVQLREALSVISDTARRSFALSCAQHTLSFYETWSADEQWGSPSLFIEVLSKIEDRLQTVDSDFSPLTTYLSDVEANIPDADDFMDAAQSGAMDAGVSVFYALKCALDGSVDSASEAGRASIIVYDITSHAFDDHKDDDIATRDLAPEAIAEWERQLRLIQALRS